METLVVVSFCIVQPCSDHFIGAATPEERRVITDIGMGLQDCKEAEFVRLVLEFFDQRCQMTNFFPKPAQRMDFATIGVRLFSRTKALREGSLSSEDDPFQGFPTGPPEGACSNLSCPFNSDREKRNWAQTNRCAEICQSRRPGHRDLQLKDLLTIYLLQPQQFPGITQRPAVAASYGQNMYGLPQHQPGIARTLDDYDEHSDEEVCQGESCRASGSSQRAPHQTRCVVPRAVPPTVAKALSDPTVEVFGMNQGGKRDASMAGIGARPHTVVEPQDTRAPPTATENQHVEGGARIEDQNAEDHTRAANILLDFLNTILQLFDRWFGHGQNANV